MPASDGLPAGAAAQLAALEDLQTRFAATGIDCWLRGGWAIDFLVGVVTRSHADIDLVVERAHRERLRALLAEAGYELAVERDVQLDYRRDGVEISLVFIERASDGSVGVPGIPSWGWLPGALDEPPRTLEGVTCRPLSMAQLADEKERYERGTGRPLRPKDIESLDILYRLLARVPQSGGAQAGGAA